MGSWRLKGKGENWLWVCCSCVPSQRAAGALPPHNTPPYNSILATARKWWAPGLLSSNSDEVGQRRLLPPLPELPESIRHVCGCWISAIHNEKGKGKKIGTQVFWWSEPWREFLWLILIRWFWSWDRRSFPPHEAQKPWEGCHAQAMSLSPGPRWLHTAMPYSCSAPLPSLINLSPTRHRRGDVSFSWQQQGNIKWISKFGGNNLRLPPRYPS